VYSESIKTKILGFAIGVPADATSVNSLYPGRPLDNIGPKSIRTGVLGGYQNGYQFYIVITHNWGLDHFAIDSVSAFYLGGNSNIIRKNNQT
jgi:hypothetical protein